MGNRQKPSECTDSFSRRFDLTWALSCLSSADKTVKLIWKPSSYLWVLMKKSMRKQGTKLSLLILSSLSERSLGLRKKYDPEAILALFLLSQWNCSSLYWWNSGKCMILTEENSWTVYYGSSKLQMKFWISLVWGNQWIKSFSYFLFLQLLVLLRSPTFAKVFFFAQLILIKAEA